MSRVFVERFDDFTGGLNLRADQFQLERNESPDMLNVEIDPRGGLFTRGAMREINPTPVAVTWTPQKLFPLNGTDARLMLSTTERVLHSSGGDFSVLEYSAGNPVAPVSSHGSCMTQWGPRMYMTTGKAGDGGYRWLPTDTYAEALTASGVNPKAWQSSADLTALKMPTAEHVCVHANKMFVANTIEATVAHPNRVRWSLENIPHNWGENDYIDFEGGGEGITAIASVAGQLVVFKSHKMFVVYGYDSDDFQVVEVSSQLGALSHEHMAVGPTGVYFFSHPQGLYYYNGSQVIDLFERLKAMYPSGYINKSADDEIFVSFVNERVWLSMPFSKITSVDFPSVSFVYDPTIGDDGAWVAHSIADGKAPIGGCDWTDSTGETRHFMCHPTVPSVLEVDVYQQEKDLLAGEEVGFDSYYRTGWVDGQNYSSKKMFRRADMVVKQVDTPRNINIKVFHNYEEAVGNERKNFNLFLPASSDGMLWGVGVWGSDIWGYDAEGAQVLKGNNLGYARSVQLLLTGPVGLFWGIDSIAYKYNVRKVTG
jgi:hypothetical protein